MKSCYYIIISLMVICIIPSILSAVISVEDKEDSLLILRNDTSLSMTANRSLKESRSSNMYRDGLGNGGGGHGNGGQQKRPKRKKGSDLMSKILPMMVMPFLISSSMIPMALTSLKFMLLKSIFVGKIAILLIALNAFWRTQNNGGVYSHNINIEHDQKDLHMEHYGFNGETEVGAYVNRRTGKR